MSWRKILAFVSKNKQTIFLLLLVFLLAVFFRFYNFPNRWGLASDQARDALVALEAIHLHTLPLIGPFSASGPFVFGPYMYWFLMLLGILFPFGFIFIWIGLAIVSTFMAVFMILVGKEIEDTRFGLLLGFFTAISTTQIGLATNLVSSTLVGLLSIVTVYFFTRCIKYSTRWNYFLLGLFLSLTINTHFQAIPLLLLLPAVLLVGKRGIKNIFLLLLGCIIPFMPLMIFDIKSHFYESSHLFAFFFFPNAAVRLPNRWLMYAGQTWPRFWGLIIGGNPFIGTISILLSFTMITYYLVKRDINRIILSVASVYALIFILLRYFSGRIFNNFVSYLDPFILILVT